MNESSDGYSISIVRNRKIGTTDSEFEIDNHIP